MKTAKIHVNKTAEKPEGVEIEIVQPAEGLEARVMSYLLANAVREARHDHRIPYKLPTAFHIEHRGEGTFVIVGTPPPPETAAPVAGSGYYQPPRPLAIVGLRAVGQTFELIHAELNQDALKRVAEARQEGQQPPPSAKAHPSPQPQPQGDSVSQEQREAPSGA